MKNVISLLVLVLAIFSSYAQQLPPAIDWQKCLGGSQNDGASRILQTTDGGYLLASITSSSDGDIPKYYGNFVLWLVKFSSTGSIQWQRFFGKQIGGVDMKNTPDGGYIVTGNTTQADTAFPN